MNIEERVSELEKIINKGEIEAKNIRIVDERGNVRISLSAGDEAAGIMIYDKNGINRISLLLLDPEGPMFGISDDKRNNLFSVATSEDGGSIVSVNDKKGQVRINISMVNETPSITLLNESGEPRLTLLAGDNKTAVRLSDEDHINSLNFTVEKRGAIIHAEDGDDEIIWSYPG